MIVSKTQAKSDEELLRTPIVSNRSVPENLTLESLDQFSLDSPASALTERSNNSNSSGDNRQKRTFRFSCPDEEPIIVPRSRIVNRDRDSQNRERGLSRSKSPLDDERRRRKDRLRRRPLAPLSLISSITTLMNAENSNGNINGSNDKDNNREERLVVGSTSQLIVARDILSCWARDFAIEILRRFNENGSSWFLPNSIYHAFFNIHNNSRALVNTKGRTLPASQELRIRWNRRKKLRNLSFRKRREQPICISGLPNQGQTCFLNSVLQSLASLEPFLQYLEGIVDYQEEKEQLYLSSTLSQEAKKMSFGGYRRLFFGYHDMSKHSGSNFLSSSFSKELLDLLKGINNMDGEIVAQENERRRRRRKRLDPKALLHKIAKTNPQFSSYGMSEQQDAQELFASLIEVVIHDSELDNSSSDHRLEVASCDIPSKSEQSSGIGRRREFGFEIDENDGPMTSAFAHFNKNKKELASSVPTPNGNAKALAKSLDSDQITPEVARIDDEGEEDVVGCETNILSLSEILLRVGNERKRFQVESNISKNSIKSRQDYRNNFPEEKKQEHCDTPVNAATETSAATTTVNVATSLYQVDRSSEGLFSSGLSQSKSSSSSVRRRMRSTMSPITPSPLSGWLGSTLRCSKCKHVRPINNAPFLDIPLVPTSVPSYLSRAYQKSTAKPPSPNSSRLPSCSLENCLEIFTSAENVDDVECRSCTIQAEIERLEEEAMMLKGAVETMERRILSRTKGSTTNGKDKNALELQSLEETKCLREDLTKVETRLMELKVEDPDQGDDDKPSDNCDSSEDEDFFFGATDPRDETPMQRCRANKCLLLTRTPSVLCCHIQRRYYDPFNGNMEKCVQFVEFPQFLDLSPYCAYGPLAITPWVAGSLRKESKTHRKHGNMPYQLQSVIEHRGNAFGGHYVSYRRDHTGSWFCISDSLVTPVSWREVQTCQAYMLFYEAL